MPSTAILQTATGQHKGDKEQIPDYLIYETVRGKPIYYKGYREVLNHSKTFEEIKMESTLQAWLKANISGLLINLLVGKGYDVMTGELGLILSDDDKRGADISIFKSENLTLDEHFTKTPPEIIFEIDVVADPEDNDTMEYILQKTEDYLQFGVKKVIWIFTKNKKTMLAEGQSPWLTFGWESDIDLLESVSLNIADMLAKRQTKK
ncbi:MAG TPA: Uma2 family endonuclease [Bacteroidetes bacterium]|nr:Uma2 family endonuclease [Bacteroidota bacterium]